MINDLEIALRADNPATNCCRDYTLAMGRDLLGDWCISVRWGRVGAMGSLALHAFCEREEATAFAGTLLRRRLTAPRRIGCPYRLISGAGIESFGLGEVVAGFPAAPSP